MSECARRSGGTMWLKLTLVLAVVWEAPVVLCVAAPGEPSAAGESKPPAKHGDTPEAALHDFLIAITENDQAGIERTALPNPELSLLWQGEKLTPAQKAIAAASVDPSKFRRLKVGEVVQIPRGQKIVMDEKRINERVQQLVLPEGPLPFSVVKVGDRWKVDASPIIAGRVAASAVSERNAAKSRPHWVAEKKLLERLAADTLVGGLKFRPPAGYEPINIPVPAGQSSGWIGKRRQDGTFPSIIVIVVSAGPDQNRSLSSLLKLTLPQIQTQFATDWTQSPIELGRIDNLVSARAHWNGVAVSGPKEFVGHKMHGVVYLSAYHGKFVEVMIQDVADDDASLSLGEASALTLRPASDKPSGHGAKAPDDKQKSTP